VAWRDDHGGGGRSGPAVSRFSLPPEHAAFLTRVAAGDSIAVFAQYIAVMGGVEDDIVACFRAGGGVPYSRFSRFHEVMAEEAQSVLSSLETHIPPLVPSLTDRFSEGIRMLDVGCGRSGAHRKQARGTLSQEPIRRNGSLAGRDHVRAQRRVKGGSRQRRVHRGRSE
jgi:hypothetical protein